ncbi:nucleolar pre-ribosomal-associated protein 1-like [Chamaea fasciata]|uniref:nucleolar pre-ribosomal-associated protein 1-like n=1 Tax=Chamaea fasciata TaxID=190680 RepID=UPI003369E0BD
MEENTKSFWQNRRRSCPEPSPSCSQQQEAAALCRKAERGREEHMYIKVNRFLLSHQYSDLRKVPVFSSFSTVLILSTKHSVSRSLGVLGKGCVTNIAVSFMTARGFSRSFSAFSTVLCVMRAPRVVCWRYSKMLPMPAELPMS